MADEGFNFYYDSLLYFSIFGNELQPLHFTVLLATLAFPLARHFTTFAPRATNFRENKSFGFY